jgi:hypothetical protein
MHSHDSRSQQYVLTLHTLALSVPLFVACGHAELGIHQAPSTVPGEDSSLALLPGQGLNHLTWEPKGTCVEIDAFRTQSGQSTGQIAEYRMLELNDAHTLRTSLKVSASASLKFGMAGSGSGRFNFMESVNKNSQSRYLLVHTRVSNQLNIANGITYTPGAQQLLRTGRGHDFTQQCGTEFVSAYRTGGEFYALFQFELRSRQEERHFDAAIEASGLAWKAAASINQDLARFDLSSRVQVQILRVGGTGEIPEISNLDEFARSFPRLVESAGGAPVTLELVTRSYDGVEPVELRPNTEALARQERVINQLASNRDQALEAYNTILYIRRQPDLFDDTDEGALNASEESLLRYINAQYDAAVSCFADLHTGCRLPEVAFPSVSLPARVFAEDSCDADHTWFPERGQCCRRLIAPGECRIPGPDGTCLAWSESPATVQCM